MDDKLLNNLKSESRWLRLLFMMFYLVAGYFAGVLVLIVAMVQMVTGFVSGAPNTRLLMFSKSLNCYLFQVLEFLTYNAEDKPFPFSDWPEHADCSKHESNTGSDEQ
ncbi:DUF4389 domain-containing protein [Endozoicomonas montiporae]|uniref:Lipase n=1 Tax=Endozoicomonas montiporae CL-33 TaxID=570277 RepID=A0A142BDA0_9GAMM|nr:DUF4389 domain-containing protein [Endozoicomonas montiporae]AMO56726.1 hypothetical protein EZMO1_2663 [Endozoicomonas montiporae CL-33]